MKKTILLISVILLVFYSISCRHDISKFTQEEFITEENSVKTKIEKYYDMAYDIYLNMEMEDMSSILSMESI